MVSNFVSSFPELSDFVIVRVLIGDEESARDGTPVGIPPFAREEGVVVNHIVRVHGVVERQ